MTDLDDHDHTICTAWYINNGCLEGEPVVEHDTDTVDLPAKSLWCIHTMTMDELCCIVAPLFPELAETMYGIAEDWEGSMRDLLDAARLLVK